MILSSPAALAINWWANLQHRYGRLKHEALRQMKAFEGFNEDLLYPSSRDSALSSRL